MEFSHVAQRRTFSLAFVNPILRSILKNGEDFCPDEWTSASEEWFTKTYISCLCRCEPCSSGYWHRAFYNKEFLYHLAQLACHLIPPCVCVCVCGNVLRTCHPPVRATRVHWISLESICAGTGGRALIDKACDLKTSYIFLLQMSLPYSETFRKASVWTVLSRRTYVILYQLILLQFKRFIWPEDFL